jgi:hypothetical protein
MQGASHPWLLAIRAKASVRIPHRQLCDFSSRHTSIFVSSQKCLEGRGFGQEDFLFRPLPKFGKGSHSYPHLSFV